MAKVSVVQRPDGGVTVCPIARERRADETTEQFRHAVTRRALAEVLSAANSAAMTNEELLAYLRKHDDAMTLEAEAAKIGAVVVGIVEAADLPQRDEFRSGWGVQAGRVIHDLSKCKSIAHDRRRRARAAEFAPLDIEATIPAKAAQAEAARQAIRDKYDAMQSAIDAAQSVEQIKAALA